MYVSYLLYMYSPCEEGLSGKIKILELKKNDKETAYEKFSDALDN